MPEETNIAYVTVVLVTFKFQQIVRSWYSVHVTFVCAALCKIYLRSNLPNLFKIRRVVRKLWQNTFWCVFYAPQCISSPQRIADHMYMHTAKNNYI